MNRNTVFAYALCLFGFLISAYCFYPGYFHYDSVVQYHEAQNFVFANWHPPIMSFLWAILLRLFPFVQVGAPMLMFQLLLFWAALAIWVFILARQSKTYLWLVPVFAFFPTIFIYSGVLLKDVEMGNALLLAFALGFLLKQNLVSGYFRNILFLLMVLLGFYAFCLRHEAVFACISLFYYWSEIFFTKGHLEKLPFSPQIDEIDFEDRKNQFHRSEDKIISFSRCPKIKTFYRVFFVLYFIIIFGFLSYVFNFVISCFDEKPGQQVLFYDLASMSLREHELLIPPQFCDDAQTCFVQMQKTFKFTRVDEILGAVVGFNALIPPRGAYYIDLERAWFFLIIHHPWVYLQERAAFFRGTLIYSPEFYGHLINVTGFYQVPDELPKAWVTHYLYIDMKLASMFRLWFWLSLNLLGLLVLAFRRKFIDAAWFDFLCVQFVSGLLMSLSHFVVAAASDFRYNYWLMIATLFTWVLMFLSQKQSVHDA